MTGRADVLDSCTDLHDLALLQEGAVSRAQLAALGIDSHHVQVHVRARRWQTVGPVVVVVYTGPLAPETRRWAAVLGCGRDAALAAWTALSEWGLRGWERDTEHVVVSRGATPFRQPWVTVHESRRHSLADVVTRNGIPAHKLERAALDAGAWAASPRAACGLLAAVVQQGLSTPERLREQSLLVGKVRHLRVMQAALDDIAGGARAMSEIDVARLCRQAGLPEPTRQAKRRDLAGRVRYLDVVWELGGGRRVALEIDGIGHMDVDRWYDDLLRAAEVCGPGETLIRLPAAAARLDPGRVVRILRRVLS